MKDIKEIEKIVDKIKLSPQKKRRKRGISRKMAIATAIVVGFFVITASAALLNYYGKVETTTNVAQSITLDGNSFSSSYGDITLSDDVDDLVGGCCQWGYCHYLHLHEDACDPVSTEVNSVVSPNDGGLTTKIVAQVQGAGHDFSAYTAPSSCDITVDGTTYSTIQAGVDAATSGQTVCVDPGTYTEDVNVNKDITLAATVGPDATNTVIIDGGVHTSADGATITGFKIQNGRTSSGDKVGISVYNANTEVTYNIIENIDSPVAGRATHGIHVYNAGSNVLISNNLIRNIDNNDNGGSYGVMVQADSDDVTINYNTFENIEGKWVGGISASPSGSVTGLVENLVIKYNEFSDFTGNSYDSVAFYVDSLSGAPSDGIPDPVIDATEITFNRNNIANSVEIDLGNKDTVHTLSAYNNWYGCEGLDTSGDVHATWNTWSDGDTITLDPNETVYFMIQYCTQSNAVGNYHSTVKFLPS